MTVPTAGDGFAVLGLRDLVHCATQPRPQLLSTSVPTFRYSPGLAAMPRPEDAALKTIDDALVAAGWVVQDRDALRGGLCSGGLITQLCGHSHFCEGCSSTVGTRPGRHLKQHGHFAVMSSKKSRAATPPSPSTTTTTRRSPELVQFDATLERLNEFYWLIRAACELAAKHPPHAALPTLVSTEVSSHLKVRVEELCRLVPEATLRARYAILVQAITAYEDYLARVLTSLLTKKLRITTTYTVKLRLDELPEQGLLEHIKKEIVDTEVDRIIRDAYSTRISRINNLLKEHELQPPRLSADDAKLIADACEVRNAIIHASGMADARAVEALQDLFPGLTVGTKLIVDEGRLWKMLGALRQGVLTMEDSLHRRGRAFGSRAWSRRKNREPGTRHPTKPSDG